jgi:hypothetical protein
LIIFCWGLSKNFSDYFKKYGFTNSGISAYLFANTNTSEIYEFEEKAKNASAKFYKDSKVIFNVTSIKGQIILVLDRMLNHTNYTSLIKH